MVSSSISRMLLVAVFLSCQGCAIGPDLLAHQMEAQSIAWGMNKQSMQTSAPTLFNKQLDQRPIGLNKKDPMPLLKEATWAYQNQRWDLAAALYREVLEHAPEDAYAWFRLGNCLTRLGQYSQAIYAYETSLQHKQRQSKPWFNLSTAHLLGAHVATLRALESLPAEDPKRSVVKQRLDVLAELLS